MEDILTSDYARQFIEKIDKHELFTEDLKMLHESGYLRDTELYFELKKYCENKNVNVSNSLWFAMQKEGGASAVSDSLLELLDDSMMYKLWKKVCGVLYGKN